MAAPNPSESGTIEVVAATIRVMNATGVGRRLTVGGPSAPLRDVVARLRAVPGRVRTSEYVTLGSSARFRAIQRTRTRAAARVGFLVIAASAIFDAAVLYDRDAGKGPILLALNGGMAALALVAWWLLGSASSGSFRGRLRRPPEPIAATVTLALTAATAATGVVAESLAVETVGYLLLFPGLIALILPWRTISHVRWLVAYAAITISYFVPGPSTELTADDRGDLVVVALVALFASLAGHVLLQNARIRNFGQLRKIDAMRRKSDADMAELARVYRTLEITARTDPLTGAGNRVRLVEDLRTARARMNRLGEAYGILAIDLDRFKFINDTRGHLAGDDVLRSTVAAIQKTIRGDDAIYRFGGEEFLVILRGPLPEGLAIAAERIRQAVEATAIPHPENVPFGVVSISVGAVLITQANLVDTDDQWFARADAALYQAKESGRNRVALAA